MMLQVENLNYSYGNVQVLFDMALDIPKGEMVCIMGRNGVGKTTVVRNLLGILNATSGSVVLENEDITNVAAYNRAAKGIAYVPQGRQIFPKLTIEENLRVGLASRKDKIPPEVFEFFPVLAEMINRMGGDLSGGQQQQLAIARALVMRPKLLILDEPTEGIQPNIIQTIGKVLKHLKDESGMTILIVEQYLDFVKEYCDRFFLMNRGRTVATDTIDKLSGDLIEKYLHV